ncbi:GDSL-type esterase/lipase family protein [Romboutsia sedimentorum]|uniref:GDSL-type esterase/lipase family protein n=1 Tax=Romboutsia sedimentorum TaxID=1368474 RepID=A0ABT7E6I0_9FIRM|nr:GDSL-type esterase/lipase family protein [Romboutsia sedimentorum]MDK2562524.1 GDSL-type esterase/lipase family protein [Romboutsia sedimentorum]
MKKRLNKKKVIIVILIPLVVVFTLLTVIIVEGKKHGNSSEEATNNKESDDKHDINENIKNGVSDIKKLEVKSIEKIQAQINSIQNKNQEDKSNTNNERNKKIDYETLFENTVIMGDSRTESLTEYGMLSNSSVVAYKGRTTAKAKDDVSTIVDLVPSKIIMTYGMNDLQLYSNSDDFIKSYEILIKDVKSKLPNSKIYVTSILPVQQNAVEEEPKFNKLEDFNIALESLCSDLQIEFMNVGTLNSKYYEPDGIHFRADAYPILLNLMAKKANL